MTDQMGLFEFDLPAEVILAVEAVARRVKKQGGKSVLQDESTVKQLLYARYNGWNTRKAAMYAQIDPSAFSRLVKRGKTIFEKKFAEEGDAKENVKLADEIAFEESPEALFYLHWTSVLNLMELNCKNVVMKCLIGKDRLKAATSMLDIIAKEKEKSKPAVAPVNINIDQKYLTVINGLKNASTEDILKMRKSLQAQLPPEIQRQLAVEAEPAEVIDDVAV